ncbi:MAG: hypothetical protein Q9175_005090 [Cornicularia normoerica]
MDARRRRAKLRLQAARQILRGDLIYQTDELVGTQNKCVFVDIDTSHTVAARAEPMEVVHLASIAAYEHGTYAVNGGEILSNVCECQRGQAVTPTVENVLAFIKDEYAVALFGVEEAVYEMQDGMTGVAGEIRE